MGTQIIIVLSAIAFICCLLTFVFIFIIQYQKRVISFRAEKEVMKSKFSQEILQSQIEVQEYTFSSLSKELHDNVGQLLSTTKMLLGITERSIANPPDTLITANETVGKAINELRSLSKSLNKEWLEQFDLISNLEAEVQRVHSGKSIQIILQHPGKLNMKANEQIILFRTIQEALQNALKHAKAKTINIAISEKNNTLLVGIKDDGHGFNIAKKSNGVGLLNMKHRTELLKGSLSWQSNSGGTSILIQLPI